MYSSILSPLTLENIEKINLQLASLSKTIEDSGINKVIKRQQEMAEDINKVLAPMFKRHQQFSEILEPIIKRNQLLAEKYSKSINIDDSAFKSISTIQSLFSDIEKISKGLRSIDFNTEEITLENIPKDIELDNIKIISAKVDKGIVLSKDDINSFITIVALLFTFYTHFFPDDFQHIKTQQHLEDLGKKVTKLTNNQTIYYEVTKQVHVREYPNSSNKSKKLDILYPKTKLLIIQSQPYWIQVEYFHEKKQETIIGWVSKRYTKRLEHGTL